MGNKLYVGNLSYDTQDDDLRTLFSEAGTVTSAQVITDRETSRSRGFGFVEMETSEQAQKAISQINGRDLQGRNLKVNEAESKPRSSGGGGGGYGGGSSRGGRY